MECKYTNEKNIIKIPSDIRNLRKVSSEILGSISSYKIDESGIFNIRLCVEEAVKNAIVHGNRSNKKLSVRVSYWINDDKLTIEVEDEGAGFDHERLPDPTADENLLRTSGRGVYLIKRLMDEVEYNQNGNKIRMTKHLA